MCEGSVYLTVINGTSARKSFINFLKTHFILKNTLGDFVKTVQQSDKDCEVDPTKMPNITAVTLEKNRHQLILNVEAAWADILNRFVHLFAYFRT